MDHHPGLTSDASGQINNSYSCAPIVDGGTVAGTFRQSQVNFAGPGHTFNNRENCSTTGVHQVTAGTHKVTLTISGVNPATTFGSASVWALFVPFDGNGNRP
jgi:hypothetical protein